MADPKNPGDILFFLSMFVACVGGSIGIFVFAVGLEIAHPIVEDMMKALLEHAGIILGLFVLFNLVIYAIWAKWIRQSARKQV